MRNRKQSKISGLIVTCAVLLAGILIPPPSSQASGIVAITQPDGRIVYINTNNPANRSRVWRLTHGPRPAPAKIDSLVRHIASRYQVDPKLVRAVIQAESNYNPQAVSSKGAMGLMQLIPATARRFGVGNPFDPKENIKGGVSYLKYLLNLFGGSLPLSLAAYNAGENSVIRSGGIPAIPETEHYVQKVTRLYHSQDSSSVTPATLPAGGAAPIYRYVDSAGVVHFTNVE